MTISRATVNKRADAVRAALLRADTNRDGRLSAAEQKRALASVTGANDLAVRESYKQARLRSGFVSVAKARSLVNLARSRALGVDRNRNGISAAERARLSGPIARALTRAATGGSGVSKPPKAGPVGASFGPKARRLAEAARRQARLMNTTGWCARGVNRAMRAAGLATSPLPSAYMYANRLAGDRRFREIKNVSDAQLRKLPAGAIVVFDKFAGRGKHGHIMVTLGGGLEASDHIQRIGVHGRQRVFVPVG